MSKSKAYLNNTSIIDISKTCSDTLQSRSMGVNNQKKEYRIKNKENLKSSLVSRSSSVVSVTSQKTYNIHPPFPKDFSLKGKYVFVEIQNKNVRGKMMRNIEIFGGIPSTDPDSKIPFAFAVSDDPCLFKVKRKDYKTSMERVLKFCDGLDLFVYSTVYLYNFLRNLSQLHKMRNSENKSLLPKTNAPISLKGYFIKIQHYKTPSAPFVKFAEKAGSFLNMYIGDSAGRSAFHVITSDENKKREERRKGVSFTKEKKLKLEGYCEFCNIRVPDRFNHCQMDIHRRAVDDKASEYHDLDRYLGFFDKDFQPTFKHPNVKKNIIKSRCGPSKIDESEESKKLAKEYFESRFSTSDLPDSECTKILAGVVESIK
uniref:DBF4-type domain-containing protein n=1 Tax=Strongyloides stercoralis TaxID=6248 RepID=A0A0K0E997_STRER